MSETKDTEFEKFPVQKTQIRFEEPPALIFFDVDEDQEEAEFIRVDDLFAAESEPEQKLPGVFSATLFPARSGRIIDSKLSREIRRTLAISAIRLQHPLEKVRIRPAFAQWHFEILENDEPEYLIREFRADLEEQIHSWMHIPGSERYWSNTCFISPIDKEIPDEAIIRLAAEYRENG